MKTFGEAFRERYTIKPNCFGKIDFDSDKCGQCPVVGQCFEKSSHKQTKRPP